MSDSLSLHSGDYVERYNRKPLDRVRNLARRMVLSHVHMRRAGSPTFHIVPFHSTQPATTTFNVLTSAKPIHVVSARCCAALSRSLRQNVAHPPAHATRNALHLLRR